MKRLIKGLYRLVTNPNWGYLFFWGWNLAFVIMVVGGLLPVVLIEVIPAVREGLIPYNFFFLSLLFLLIPFLFIYIGFRAFGDKPKQLFGLLYGIEWPLMALMAFRFFGVKQLTPLLTLVFVVAGFSMAVYGWQLLDDRIDKRGRTPTMLRMAGLSSLLMLGVYVATIPGIFVLPILSVFFTDFLPSVPEELSWIFRDIGSSGDPVYYFLMFVMWAMAAGLAFVAIMIMPIFVPILYGRAWWRGVRASRLRLGRPLTFGIVGITAAVLVTAFTQMSKQPQLTAYQLLQEPPQTLEEAYALEKQEDVLRAGLLDAYLGAYRYPGVTMGENAAEDAWRSEMRTSDETAQAIGDFYARVITPFSYRPMDAEACNETVRWELCWTRELRRWDANEAAKLYQSYFDEPINDGEKAQVVDAVRQTWNPDTAMSQWQAVDDREVWVEKQNVTITEHGDWAEVELHEVYRNQTFEQGEVVYYFSLPESAVVTGVWLGDDENGKVFEHIVAPRGAAQQVYQEQVQVTRQDPALVEQIGPSQYRMRIFPIPQRTTRWDSTRMLNKTEYLNGEALHVWLNYSVLGTEEGWPMPELTEKRNAYWTDQSERMINGDKIKTDNWLPAYADAVAFEPKPSQRVDLPNGYSVLVVQEEYMSDANVGKLTHLNAAVVLDRSYSMRDVADEAAEAIRQLDGMMKDVDLFLTAAENRGEAPAWLSEFDEADLDNIFYFGGQHAAQLLKQYDDLRDSFATSKQYDVVFVITDDSGYELGEVDFDVPRVSEPVWMVHLGGSPIGYDDDTLEVLQASGGGSVTAIDDALTRFAVMSNNTSTFETDHYDQHRWITKPTDEVDDGIPMADDGFAPIAARRYIISEMMANRGDLSDVDTLRDIHAIAVDNSIVTPYSSMIVLVNQRQLDQLKELSEQDDAFDREFEEVGQTEQLQATAVPEPEEWLLIITGACLFGYYIRKNRQQGVSSSFLSF